MQTSATFVRQVLLRAMITAQKPADELVAATDTLGPMIAGGQGTTLVMVYGQVADALVFRGEQLDRAVEYGKKAYDACPKGERFEGIRAACEMIIGRAELERNNFDAAIASLTNATASPDSQLPLRYLGHAYERSGRADEAIDAYVRSIAVFPGGDTSAAGPLRDAYTKRHGSLQGMEAKVEAARAKSRERVALDARRHDQPSPDWKLPDLAGKTVQSDEFKGKIMVVDFWGSWCGPCRAELPVFQAAFDRYKDRGVAFLGINWERAQTNEGRLKAATDYMKQGGYTFPVVIDHNRLAVEAFSIDAFPTLFVIDHKGQIRYRNVGLSHGIEHILEAQIESLMAEAVR